MIKENKITWCFKAHVYNVVDGDTFDAEVDLGFKILQKIRFRVLDIDTPEPRGESREKGLEATRKAEELLLGKTLIIRSHKKGKWRYLASVELEDGSDFASEMIKAGYDTGKRW